MAYHCTGCREPSYRHKCKFTPETVVVYKLVNVVLTLECIVCQCTKSHTSYRHKLMPEAVCCCLLVNVVLTLENRVFGAVYQTAHRDVQKERDNGASLSPSLHCILAQKRGQVWLKERSR